MDERLLDDIERYVTRVCPAPPYSDEWLAWREDAIREALYIARLAEDDTAETEARARTGDLEPDGSWSPAPEPAPNPAPKHSPGGVADAAITTFVTTLCGTLGGAFANRCLDLLFGRKERHNTHVAELDRLRKAMEG